MKHSMRQKGDMALEYIFKILILLVAVAVIIGLILTFVQDARSAVIGFMQNLFPKAGPKPPTTVEKETFNSGEIAAHIESCYSSHAGLPETEQEDVVCVTLLAKNQNGITATKQEVLDNVDVDVKNHLDISTDFSKSYVVIEFVEVGNRVNVR